MSSDSSLSHSPAQEASSSDHEQWQEHDGIVVECNNLPRHLRGTNPEPQIRTSTRTTKGIRPVKYTNDDRLTDSGKPRKAKQANKVSKPEAHSQQTACSSTTETVDSIPNDIVRQRNRTHRTTSSRGAANARTNATIETQQSNTPVSTQLPASEADGATQNSENDIFMVRAGVPGSTILTDLGELQLGALTMLPNSMSYFPPRTNLIIKRVFRKYLLNVLDHSTNTAMRWKKLLLLPTVLLTVQSNGDIIDSIMSKCERLLTDDWSSFTLQSLLREGVTEDRSGMDREAATKRHLNAAVNAAASKGNIAKAYQRATNATELAAINDATIAKLQAKHPSRQQQNIAGPQRVVPVSDDTHLVELDPEDIKWALQKAKKGTKHGIDKLRVEHLKALYLYGGTDDLRAFTRLCNKIANDQIPAEIWPWLRDSELIALPKGTDDIRPIVISGALRKVVLSALKHSFKLNETPAFTGTQYGMVRSGAEKIIHTLRACREQFPQLNTVVLDATNAFNSARREPALYHVKTHYSPLLRIVNALYGGKSTLRLNQGSHELVNITAETGFQQGCVLGSWLYCLSLQPLIDKICEAMADEGIVKFFIDDGNISATFEATLRAFAVIREHGPRHGYHIKWSAAKYLMGKCDTMEEVTERTQKLLEIGFAPENIIRHPDDHPSTPVNTYGVGVLGAFIGENDFVRACLQHKLAKWDLEAEKLCELDDCQVRFMLLRWCFKSKVHYWLRNTPSECIDEFVTHFDSTKRHILESILRPPYRTTQMLSDTDWMIAQLLVSVGGLGLELTRNVQLAAVVAAAVATAHSLGCVDQMYSSKFQKPLDPGEPVSAVRDFHRALAVLKAIQPGITWACLKKMNKRGTLQHQLSAILHADTIKKMAQSPASHNLSHDRINWLTSLHSREAGLWLQTYRTWGFKFTNEEFATALAYRLFLDQPRLLPGGVCRCHNNTCIVDARGHHLATGCPYDGVRHNTHDSVTNTIYEGVKKFGLDVRKEECTFKALNPRSKKRMDIVVTENQHLGPQRTLMDVTIKCPVNASTKNRIVQADSQGQVAYNAKVATYGELAAEADYRLEPMVFESTGRIYPTTLTILRTIAGIKEGDKNIMRNNPLYRYWLMSISVTLQRGIARALLVGFKRVARGGSPELRHYTTDYDNYMDGAQDFDRIVFAEEDDVL